jgi:hypothetical protein
MEGMSIDPWTSRTRDVHFARMTVVVCYSVAMPQVPLSALARASVTSVGAA